MMTCAVKIKRLRAILALTLIILMGCAPKTPNLTEHEKKTMQDLTQEMTTRCVGRYLIDLPKAMKLNNQHNSKIEEVKVEVKLAFESDFENELEQRRKELSVQTLYGKTDLMLKEIIPLTSDGGLIFDRARSPSSNVLRTLELHGWKDGYAIHMEIDARDMSFSTESRSSTDTRQTTTPAKLQQLLSLFSRTQGRADSEIPNRQGTCIPNGFISGPAGVREDIGLVYELMEDVWLGFESDSGITGQNTLLDRGKDIEWGLSENEGKTVRKGSRKSTENFKFDEWLSSLRTNDHVMGHLFLLEANSKAGSAKTPLLNIDLHNGLRAPRPARPYDSPEPPAIAKASLSEAEAVALWDAITQTLRPRPGAF
jgi:hypothetical protein